MSVAALGMYDWPEVRGETDQLWAAIRDGLRGLKMDAPDALDRGGDLWSVWRSPALTLSQTCGLPFAARLAGTVSLLGPSKTRIKDRQTKVTNGISFWEKKTNSGKRKTLMMINRHKRLSYFV